MQLLKHSLGLSHHDLRVSCARDCLLNDRPFLIEIRVSSCPEAAGIH